MAVSGVEPEIVALIRGGARALLNMASGSGPERKRAEGGLMSYMRGPCDVWRDDNRLPDDGYDGWDGARWAEGR